MAIVGGIGLIFGCLLAYASIVFKVEKDDRIERIEEELPGANCGACGFAGCSAYASAIVEKGASVSIEPDGDIMGNVGIPGTGLSYRTKLNKKKKGD